jgi:hypothetical protein
MQARHVNSMKRAPTEADAHLHTDITKLSLGARPDLGQRPLLPGHAIAGWGFKTSIVTLPVVMLKARATSRISFAIRSLLSQGYVGRACGQSIL